MNHEASYDPSLPPSSIRTYRTIVSVPILPLQLLPCTKAYEYTYADNVYLLMDIDGYGDLVHTWVTLAFILK